MYNPDGAHINLQVRKQPLWMTMGQMKEGRLTGALALSKCNGLPYCSSGTKKAVYYTKDLFDFVLSFCLLKKASIFCH